MKQTAKLGFVVLSLAIAAGALVLQQANVHQPTVTPLQHSQSAFEFTVHAPFKQAVPLFGAHGERLWGGKNWDPQFIYPAPEEDREGAVFMVAGSHEQTPWVMPIFDPEQGRIQYVIFMGGALITVIDIKMTAIDAGNTKVNVTYAWTAVKPEANEHIAKMAAAHSGLGPHWEAAINSALEKAKQSKGQ